MSTVQLDRIAVFAALGCLAGSLVVLRLRARVNPVGIPPIAQTTFMVAKLCLAVSIGLLVYSAGVSPAQLSLPARIAFLTLLCGGSLIFVISLFHLGSNLRMGLPREETFLVTAGIYRFSRNPIYFALYCILAASLVYAFSWLNLLAAALAVALHHRIILAEERFLAGRFPEFEDYRRTVRRYI